ncbi:unnamed protein product [Allacma fusca]|uniref:Uncharacterized protein n=1 Tax=Allacma fusca TaxID=39272 RepID=A0A8J2JYT6_9HEXA|nr:unnamed protein product [Allacma fusca]
MAGYDNNNNCYKRSNYLHPYYVPTWNNALAAPLPLHHRSSSVHPQRQLYPPTPASPVGLNENPIGGVLSSYVPGPTTIVMFERKRKPSLTSNKYVRVACLCFIIFIITVIFWTRMFAKSEKSSFLEPEIKQFIQIPQDKENMSGYTYLNSHRMYTNVIFSYDDDEETLLETVKTFAFEPAQKL